MVNKIKFWDTENNKWVGEDTDYYVDEKGKVFHLDDSIPDDYSIVQDEHIRPVYFTGFFDIYNEPIYSNSLVKIVDSKDKDFPGFKDYLRSIRFKNGSYVVDISGDELDLVKKFGHQEIGWFNLEIVGNSFVNKPTVREVSLDMDKPKSLQYAIGGSIMTKSNNNNKIKLHGDNLNQLKLNRIMVIILKNYLIAEDCALHINKKYKDKIKMHLWGNDHIIATLAGELPYKYTNSKYPYILTINCKNTTNLLRRMKPEYQDIDNFIDYFSSL